MKRTALMLSLAVGLAACCSSAMAEADWKDRAITAGLGAVAGYGVARVTESEIRTVKVEADESVFSCAVAKEVCLGTSNTPEEAIRKKVGKTVKVTKAITLTDSAGRTTQAIIVYKVN